MKNKTNAKEFLNELDKMSDFVSVDVEIVRGWCKDVVNDFEKVSKENEELKKEIRKLRLKVARSVKKRKR